MVVCIVILIVLCCFTYLNEMFSRDIVSVCRHLVTVGTIMHHLQSLSSRATARLNTIESQQNIVDEKLSSILAIVDANTETLSELKTLLQKFMGSVKESNIASPSKSKSKLKETVGTSADPISTAKGGAVEMLIGISSPENQGDADKSNTRRKVAFGDKEGAVTTDPIHFNDGGNEDKREINVDPYSMAASVNIQEKPQSIAKMVSLL